MRFFNAIVLVVVSVAATACADKIRPVTMVSRPRAVQQAPTPEMLSCPVPDEYKRSPTDSAAPSIEPVIHAIEVEMIMAGEYDLVDNRSSKDLWARIRCRKAEEGGTKRIIWIGLIKPGTPARVPKIFLETMEVVGFFENRVTNLDHTTGSVQSVPITLDPVDNYGWRVTCGSHC